MKTRAVALGAVLAGLLTAPLIALQYLADQLAGLPFVPFDLFDWITRVLPGPVITFGIDLMISAFLLLGIDVADTAKLAEQAAAIAQLLVAGIAAGAVFGGALAWRRLRPDTLAGLIMGALFGFPLIAISLAISQSPVAPLWRALWLLVLFLGWGVLLSRSLGRVVGGADGRAITESPAADAMRLDRRRFLVQLGASTAVITVAGAGVGALLARAEQARRDAALADTMAHNAEGSSELPFPNANDPVSPVPGTRPEYTPVKDHYRVFIRTEPSVIDGATWLLPITGMVDRPLMLSLADLRNNFPARDQYVTLSCISGRVGTTLISTTLWTGASVRDVLAAAGVRSEAKYIHIVSADGFYETVDLAEIEADPRIMFCYAWDGNTLPVEHGFPLRIWLPDRFGMKQPKWITGVEVTDTYTPGYWVERNWDEIARVQTTSVIDTVAVDALIADGDERRVPIGGIAFSGDRQISRVEVRVDGGPWQPAQLRSPLSETTWVIWRYEWPFAAGEHRFEVRCAEGDGTPQIEAERPSRPSGARGIHAVERTITG